LISESGVGGGWWWTSGGVGGEWWSSVAAVAAASRFAIDDRAIPLDQRRLPAVGTAGKVC
jgi:hypothetical protein